MQYLCGIAVRKGPMYEMAILGGQEVLNKLCDTGMSAAVLTVI